MSQKRMITPVQRILELEVIINKQKEAIAQLNDIVEALPGSIYLKNKEGVYLWNNIAARKKMQSVHLSKSIIGKTDYDLFSKQVADSFRINDIEVMETGKEHISEEVTKLVDGTKITHLSVKRPVYTKNKDVKGIIGISIDITDRKRAEEYRIKHEAAEKTIKFTNLLAGSMAHELRTPLQGIGAQIDLVEGILASKNQKQKDKNDNLRLVVKNIKHIIKNAARTINDMLIKIRTFANGKLPKLNFETRFIVSDIEEILNNYPFEKGQRELVVTIYNSDFKYLGEKSLTNHLLSNLLKNALYAIKETEKTDAGIIIETKTNNNFNQLIFRDTAIGIDKNFVSKIFDQFETKKSESGGTGLGLALCKMIVEDYGGNITCNSSIGKYTEFVINIPKVP